MLLYLKTYTQTEMIIIDTKRSSVYFTDSQKELFINPYLIKFLSNLTHEFQTIEELWNLYKGNTTGAYQVPTYIFLLKKVLGDFYEVKKLKYKLKPFIKFKEKNEEVEYEIIDNNLQKNIGKIILNPIIAAQKNADLTFEGSSIRYYRCR